LPHAERGKPFWIREFLAGMRLCRACGATPFRLPIPIFNFSGVYLKISEPISLTGSAGGRAKTKPPFRPPRLACPTEAVRRREVEAKRTIPSFSFRF